MLSFNCNYISLYDDEATFALLHLHLFIISCAHDVCRQRQLWTRGKLTATVAIRNENEKKMFVSFASIRNKVIESPACV